MPTLTTARPAHRTLADLFERYAGHHRNPTNKLIHWACVPLITWTVLAFLWMLHPLISVAFAVAGLVYYLRLSPSLAAGMLVIGGAMIALNTMIPNLGYPALSLFIAAWIGQFIGHKIEGAKPSFFEDLHFLLIGPVWLLASVYDWLGLRY